MESPHDDDLVFYCEESPLNINPENPMNQPWYTEFALNFVARQTRYPYWNAALRASTLDFIYTPEDGMYANRLADFKINMASTDYRAAPMLITYLSKLPEITITNSSPLQSASLDNKVTFYSTIISGKYHTILPKCFEMYMRIRLRAATKSFTISLL